MIHIVAAVKTGHVSHLEFILWLCLVIFIVGAILITRIARRRRLPGTRWPRDRATGRRR